MLPPLPGAAPSFAPPARGLSEALTGIDAFLWGPWLLIPLLLGTGVVLTVRLRGLQLRMLGPALRFALLQREDGGKAAGAEDNISHYQALTTRGVRTNLSDVRITVVYDGRASEAFYDFIGFVALPLASRNVESFVLVSLFTETML